MFQHILKNSLKGLIFLGSVLLLMVLLLPAKSSHAEGSLGSKPKVETVHLISSNQITSTILYGAATGLTGTAAESSLYTIDPTNGTAILIGTIGFSNVTGLAFLPYDRLVGTARGDYLFGGVTTAILIEINRFTGAGTLIGVVDDVNTGCGRMPDITFDPISDTLYAYSDNCDLGSEGLYTIDPLTGAGTSVGASGFSGGGNGLALNPVTRILYATPGDNNSLITISTTTGAGTEVVGSTGNVSPTLNALDFHPNTNILYGSLKDDSASSLAYLVTIDTTDGTTTKISSTPTITGLDAIAFLTFKIYLPIIVRN